MSSDTQLSATDLSTKTVPSASQSVAPVSLLATSVGDVTALDREQRLRNELRSDWRLAMESGRDASVSGSVNEASTGESAVAANTLKVCNYSLFFIFSYFLC